MRIASRRYAWLALGRKLMSLRVLRVASAVITTAVMLAFAGGAAADEWLPHPAGAQWRYIWKDTSYNPAGTVENVDVQEQSGPSFTLAWADTTDQLPPAGAEPDCASATSDVGTMSFQDTDEGLINTNWNSCPPPAAAPILCANLLNPCANSLSSALYNVIWGDRVPVLSEPLLRGLSWTATGGAQNDVDSTSYYLGLRSVKAPAFPHGVIAAVVRTTILQIGALCDPYGSGTRTTWWVDGVGPVQVVFDHAGGGLGYSIEPPVTTVSLLSTNLKALKPPPDLNYFPLVVGLKGRYEWTNSRFLRQPEIETVSVAAAANRSARIAVKSVSGPIRVDGQYLFTIRLDGLTNISGQTAAATLVKLPKLGHGRHFLTPIDLMTYGFNPVLPAYPQAGDTWKSGDPQDFHVYGVTGSTRVIGIQKVHVPAGTFQALEVRSVLTQRGYPFGSGVRTSWFAPGRGLVKLIFRHRDGSVSVVQLIK
jgi:hypothetical protein